MKSYKVETYAIKEIGGNRFLRIIGNRQCLVADPRLAATFQTVQQAKIAQKKFATHFLTYTPPATEIIHLTAKFSWKPNDVRILD